MTTQRPRRRMVVDERYDQLLSVATEIFAHHPYEQAQMELIAERACASTSLIYHYFPNKRALFAAVVDRAIEELGRMTEPPDDLPPLDRCRAGVDGYIDYVLAYEHAYRAMHRGRDSGDARVTAAIQRNNRRQIERVTSVLSPGQPAQPALETAIRGWNAFIIATCLDWLDNRQLTRVELRELIMHAFIGALRGALSGAAQPVADSDLTALIPGS
ncbi:TetR/AcrR family transcriptional regulator [Nocardia sp. 004]|uniref:TetR/AcrR family transcriptional regulator n=1 Tax=Nocardia sp. 004 TaxID=3385978 RepID=UPI00399F2BFF